MAPEELEESAQPIAASSIEKPWWRSTWLKVTAGIAAIAILLANVISILSSARALPTEVQKTSDQFFNWYGEYAAWEGYWTNFPEGIVDIEQMTLSKQDFRLNIEHTKGGFISGTVEAGSICEKIPYFDQLLVDGSISSASRAEIEIFDYVGGYRRNFARIQIKRDDYIMVITPLDDPIGIFVNETRIARAPDDLIGSEGHEALCGDKRFNFIRDVLKKTEAEQSVNQQPTR